jgi:photosystem II stability/assembly factor-like uncharacterized protein
MTDPISLLKTLCIKVTPWLIIVLFVPSVAPSETGCSRLFNTVPGPSVFDDFFISASKKEWAVGGSGSIGHIDYAAGVSNSFTASTKTDLNGIYFATDKIGWVVGNNGYIAHSKNGGQTWKPQKSNTSRSLTSIYCTDTSNCWVTTTVGTVLKTSNGGRKWTTLKLPTTERLLSVRFIDRSTGIVAGNNETLLKTVDGGKTWNTRKVTFRKDASKNIYNFVSLGLRDANTYCTASSGTVACTENDGEDWRVNHFKNIGSPFIGIIATPELFYFVTECKSEKDTITRDNLRSWEFVKTESPKNKIAGLNFK